MRSKGATVWLAVRTMVVGCTCLLVLTATEGLAADAPGAPPLEAKTPWMAIVVSLIATVCICIAGFKNSRRTHLD